MEEVEQYLQHIQNNPDLDDFPMINLTIRTQITECEIAYYKICCTNPVLADVDMDFYHTLPPVQVLLNEMTRLEGLAMSLKANNTKLITTTTTTADQPQPTLCTNKDTISTTESNNNNNNNNNNSSNNKTNDNHTKAEDVKHIAEQARKTRRQHKQAIERASMVQEQQPKNEIRKKQAENQKGKKRERETARR